VCATETKTTSDLEAYRDALRDIMSAGAEREEQA
jgi:hypothetical protein